MASTYAACEKCRKLNRVNLDEGASKEPICGNCKATLPVHFGIVETDAEGLQKLIEKSPLPVLCDFWAPWCGPCKAFAPVFQQTAGRYADRVVFAKLNTEAHPNGGAAHRVRSIPTLAFFSQGKEVDRVSGALPAADLTRWIDSKL